MVFTFSEEYGRNTLYMFSLEFRRNAVKIFHYEHGNMKQYTDSIFFLNHPIQPFT